jgi:hypothetical protein
VGAESDYGKTLLHAAKLAGVCEIICAARPYGSLPPPNQYPGRVRTCSPGRFTTTLIV